MHTDPNQLKTAARAGHFSPAVVLGPVMKDRTLPVLLEDGSGHTATARVPELPVPDPGPGDTVLLAGNDRSQLYVLVVLERREPEAGSPEVITTPDGGRVEIERRDQQSMVSVYGRNDRLLFAYEPHADRMRVELQAHDAEFTVPGRLSLRARELSLESLHFGLEAETGRFEVNETTYRGHSLDAALHRSRLVIDRLETVARTVVQKAENLYRTVTGLSQMRAGRVRTLVESTYHLKSRRTYLKSRESFNIDGDKINLG